jgi:hypothetical protein
MIKDVMVRLDGTEGDGVRLAAVDQIAAMFESHVTGLFFNILPPPVSGLLDGFGAGPAAQLLDKDRQTGDVIEAAVLQCLTRLQHPTNLRRLDVADQSDIADTATLLARTVDAFVALRPNHPSSEPEGLIENLLYGAVTCFSFRTT